MIDLFLISTVSGVTLTGAGEYDGPLIIPGNNEVVPMEGNFHVGAKNEYSVSSEFIFFFLQLHQQFTYTIYMYVSV